MEKKNKYLDALYLYGFYTLVYLIDKYEKEENFEECAIITDVINHHNQEMNCSIPTKFDENSKKYLLDAYNKHNLSGEIYLSNLPFYVKEVEKMIGTITNG